MPAPRRRGRPPKPPSQRTSVLSIRLRLRLHDAICRLALARGVDVQDIALNALRRGLSVYKKELHSQSQAF